jgi:hypothetical protein
MAQPKSKGLTLLFNLIIPGTGHIYASDGERWGFLAFNVVCAITGGFLILPWLGNILIWFIALADSGNVTDAYNRVQMLEEEDEELNRRQSARAAAQAEANKAAEAQAEAERQAKKEAAMVKKAEVAQAVDAKHVCGADVAQKFMKVQTLVSAGVMDETEGKTERAKMFAKLVSGWTDEDMMDFLAPFAEMKTQNVLSDQDMRAVKNLYGALSKKRPSGT